MKTVDIVYAGRTVSLADLPDYAKFYRKLAAGNWEARTFETLGRNLDRETVLIDIGAWIGVTPFWSAQAAKAVVAVEPDPKCLSILRELSPPLGNVTILAGALAAEPRVDINAVDGFGSSETSVLAIGNGESLPVRGIRVDEIMAQAGGAPVFVKIDIEGYEYAIGAEIERFAAYPVKGMQIALHPQLYEASLRGPRLVRRVRTAWATWRLARRLRSFLPAPRFARFRGLAHYIMLGILFRRRPKGVDLVFETDRLTGVGEA